MQKNVYTIHIYSLKKITTILFLLLISYTWIAKAVILIGFEVYKQEIIAEKCENKNKPKLHCNGKCHLAKQLKKTEDGKQLPSQLFASKLEVFPCTNESYSFNLVKVSISICYTLQKKPSKGFLKDISHPPSELA